MFCLLFTRFLVIELIFKVEQKNVTQDGISILWKSIERHDLLADINFRVRLLDLKGKEILQTKNETLEIMENRVKNELLGYIDQLQNIQFDIVRNRYIISMMSDMNFDETYDLEHIQQDGSIEIYDDILYNDAVFMYITAASYIMNNTYVMQEGPIIGTL